DVENHDLPLPSLAVHNLTKITQEAIMNALKHSRATRVGVSIREKGGALVLAISDNGRGIGSGASSQNHYGLRNIQQRCDEIGASLQFRSQPGMGFEIRVSLTPDPAVKADD
ncbi:MAG: hypothetical protein LLG97_14720, partial [Deltaproteobacteria bacterium]|nr:hypothetical protein [Deltaproteobacteria bacterium]